MDHIIACIGTKALPYFDPVLDTVTLHTENVNTAELEQKIMEQTEVILKLQNKTKRKKSRVPSDAPAVKKERKTNGVNGVKQESSVTAQQLLQDSKAKKPKMKKAKPKYTAKGVPSPMEQASLECAVAQKQVWGHEFLLYYVWASSVVHSVGGWRYCLVQQYNNSTMSACVRLHTLCTLVRPNVK